MILVGDIEYNVDALKTHRAQIIELRDAALRQGDFTWSVILSHNIAILAHLIALKEGK